MSEIRDILHGRHDQLAASLRHADEFDAAAAATGVRRRRRTRAALVGAGSFAGVAGIGVAAWLVLGGAAPAPVASPSPTPSATVSASPSATPSASPSAEPTPVPVAFEGRNPGMSDDEALARAEHPATGEEWLDAPVAIDPPSWIDGAWGSVGDELADGWWEWHRVGTHDGRDVYVAALETTLVFEASPDGGEIRYIAGPEPYAEPWPWPWGDVPDGVVVDTDTYYDSLALPQTWRSPEGLSLDARDPAGVHASAAAAPVDTFGPAALIAGGGPAYSAYEDAELASLAERSMRRVTYSLVLPYGLARSVRVAAPAGTPTFDGASNVGWESDQGYVDLLDQSCEMYDDVTLLVEPDLATWRTVGTWDGSAVMAPTAASEITEPTWRAWRTFRNGEAAGPIDSQAADVDAFVDAPAILGVPTADGTSLRLYLNRAFRMRYWC